MKRKGVGGLIAFLAISVGSFVAVLVVGYKPLLGLDLQGGVSVVLQPANDVPSDQLDQAIDIIRSRVDALGVAEPDISRQGDTILVQLPGVKNQSRALDLVGQTAELRFRPVCGVLPVPGTGADATSSSTSSTTAPGGTTSTTGAGGSTTSTVATTSSSATDNEAGLPAVGAVEGESAAGFQADTTSTTAAVTADTSTGSTATTQPAAPTAPPVTGEDQDTGCPPTDALLAAGRGDEAALEAWFDENDLRLNAHGVTPRAEDKARNTVILPELKPDCERKPDERVTECWASRYVMGPTTLKGDAISDASATFGQDNKWVVNPIFKAGDPGIDEFNALAAQCFGAGSEQSGPAGTPVCPTGQMAIVLDGEVISAPSINTASFERDRIQITGSFDEGSAKDLALVLRYGALPVELDPQQTQTVSATLGTDALHAGLIAGLIGLGIATLFMVLYYRLLGVVAIISLLSGAMMLWTIIAYLGETRGLALTLAGVTGIIVSIGISLDSNVVYYEHLKEDVYNGRTLRSSVDRSFTSAFSTIVKADSASLIGAAILYFLTVGAVRGFAFYLGLAALLDLIAFYFLLRPLVAIMVRSRRFGTHPAWFGIPERRDTDPVAPDLAEEAAT